MHTTRYDHIPIGHSNAPRLSPVDARLADIRRDAGLLIQIQRTHASALVGLRSASMPRTSAAANAPREIAIRRSRPLWELRQTAVEYRRLRKALRELRAADDAMIAADAASDAREDERRAAA